MNTHLIILLLEPQRLNFMRCGIRTHIILRRPPNAALTVELAYTYKPPGLTSSNTSTWLSQNAPNVLLYGCILEALGYLKGPADMIQYYDKMYNQSVQALATYEMGA